MNGYQSDEESVYPFSPSCLKGGAKKKKAKTLKQRQAAKARRDARLLIKMAEKLPQETKTSGFHYNEDSSREIIEESRELGNQSDNLTFQPNPILKSHAMSYQYSTAAQTGKKPKVYVRGVELDYDNTKSPFIKATYLNNNKIMTGILNQAVQQGPSSTKKTPRSKGTVKKAGTKQ